jgi:hypothetical protein
MVFACKVAAVQNRNKRWSEEMKESRYAHLGKRPMSFDDTTYDGVELERIIADAIKLLEPGLGADWFLWHDRVQKALWTQKVFCLGKPDHSEAFFMVPTVLRDKESGRSYARDVVYVWSSRPLVDESTRSMPDLRPLPVLYVEGTLITREQLRREEAIQQVRLNPQANATTVIQSPLKIIINPLTALEFRPEEPPD